MLKAIRRWNSQLKVLILSGLAIYFAYIYLSGKWAYYIDPRFQWLSLVAVLLLVVLALSFFASGKGGKIEQNLYDAEYEMDGRSGGRNSFWSVLVVAVPLVLGVVIPAKPLGADALKTRGIDTNFSSVALGQMSSASLSIIPSDRNILDWARAIASSTDTKQFNGQEAKVVGFVYRDSRFGENQFMAVRFTMTCCVADAFGVGLIVQTDPDATQYAVDSWIEIKGRFQEVEFDGSLTPVLFADEIKPTEQPEQPYLYQ